MLADSLNLLGRHVRAYRTLFSIHSLPLSVALFEVSEGRETIQGLKSALSYMFHKLYPGTTQPPLGKATHLHHRRWLQLCTACPWKRVKFRSVTYCGTEAELYYLVVYMRTVFTTAVCYDVKVA